MGCCHYLGELARTRQLTHRERDDIVYQGSLWGGYDTDTQVFFLALSVTHSSLQPSHLPSE